MPMAKEKRTTRKFLSIRTGMNLGTGAKVSLTIRSGQTIVEPQSRSRLTLDELLAQCNPKASRSSQERQWLSGRRAGRELI